MDYYNFNPNSGDSLELLYGPLIKRRERLYPPYKSPFENVYIRDGPPCSRYRDPRAESSTSLVLKKTATTKRREITEEYSELSYDNEYPSFYNSGTSRPYHSRAKNRPVIKVTIIPNNAPGPLRKRRSNPNLKRVQSSVSNTEIKAKNVYLVVAGKAKKKIYEIKTTSSADLCHDSAHKYLRHNEIVDQNVTQLLSSLNMDKKKKSKKKNSKVLVESYDTEECPCELKPRKSRVRITGKIGRTEDDRYMLKCTATVDGKPIETNCFPDNYPMPTIPPSWGTTQHEPSLIRKSQANNNTNTSCYQREFNVQVNLDQEDKFSLSYPQNRMLQCPHRSAETQCNPSNFNTVCFSNIEKLKIVSNNRDQLVQCDCIQPNVKDSAIEQDFAQTRSRCRSPERCEQVYPMKTCNSPLVIISVYPKQDQQQANDDGQMSRPKASKTIKKNSKRMSKASKIESLTESFDKYPSKSRTASPSRGRKINNAKFEANIKTPKTKNKTEGSGGQITKVSKKSSRKETIQETNFTKAGSKKGGRSRTVATSEATVQANLTNRQTIAKSRGIAKEGQLDTNHHTAPHTPRVNIQKGVSDVSINIDGENELYDVTFRQVGNNTDLHVRKTVKEQVSQQNAPLSEDSIENFLLLHNGHKKRSLSQKYISNDQSKAETKATMDTVPVVNVRDSIEVCHRREDKMSRESRLLIPHPIRTSSNSSNKQLSAPIKHHIGDDCRLSNPVERDKEIRELLGVRQHRRVTHKDSLDSDPNNKGDHLLHCFFQNTQSNSFTSTATFRTFSHIYSQESSYECIDNAIKCFDSNKVTDREVDKKDNTTKLKNHHSKDLATKKSDTSVFSLDSRPKSKSVVYQYGDEQKEYHQVDLDPICQKFQLSNNFFPEVINPLYQQVILNRNVNICLQLDQFIQQKPIILSRKQYDKVKRTIENASVKNKLSSICKKTCFFSIGETRRKIRKSLFLYKERKVHTDENTKDEDCAPKRMTEVGPKFTNNRNHTVQTEEANNHREHDYCSETRFPAEGRGYTMHNKKINFRKYVPIFMTHNNPTIMVETETLYRRKNSDRDKIQHIENNRRDDSQYQTKKGKKQYITEQMLNIEKEDIKKNILFKKYGVYNIQRDLKQSQCTPNGTRITSAGNDRDIFTSRSICTMTKEYETRSKHADNKHRDRENMKREIRDMKNQLQRLKEKHQKAKEIWMRRVAENKAKNNFELNLPQCCRTCEERLVTNCSVCGKDYRNCYCVDRDYEMCPQCRRNRESTSTVKSPQSVILEKRVTFSLSDLEEKKRRPSVANVLMKYYQTDSLHTLFKGHRKTPTPNLGTSAYSLLTEYSNYSSKTKLEPLNFNPRKPFLRRLMSYLVMRSKTCEINIEKQTKPKMENISTIDSYHISTSLGEIELSSSIYDTSASFYSSHSVRPINSKTKRSFLSSFRGILAYRRN